MKKRLLTMALALLMLLGTLGCTAKGGATEDAIAPSVNFIGSKSDALGQTVQAARPAELMNFAATDDAGNALYQIVYKLGASEWLISECERLSDAIFDVTGVRVPVVHSMAKQKQYEILIGDIARAEIISVRDQFSLKNEDFLIKSVDTRLMVFSRSEESVISAVIYLTDLFAYRNGDAGEFGVDASVELLQTSVGENEVEVLSIDAHYVELKVPNSIVLSTYVRLSFTGSGGWRIQTKLGESDEYDDIGASQRLAISLGEAAHDCLEEIETASADGALSVTAKDGSCVVINLSDFCMDFYSPSGALSATITSLVTNQNKVSIKGALESDEALFGTGERFNGANQRGKFIDMFSADIWSKDSACYMVIPLICSSRGSGIFINLYEHMTLDLDTLGKNEWTAEISNVPLDVYIFTTDRIADAITAYSELSGYAEMPEEWTYGMIVCSYGPDFSDKWTANITPDGDGRGEGVYELIAYMEKYDLPWTGVLAEGWNVYTGGKHEDLKELCDYVHSLGKKFIMYMGAASVDFTMSHDHSLASFSVGGFDMSYYLYQQVGDTKTHLLPQTTENNNNPDNSGAKRYYLDITNPDAITWYFDEYWDYLCNDIGVDGCKIDFCELLPENCELLYYDKTTKVSGSHHWFPTAFCAMYWDVASAKPDSGMCFSRGGGIGSQRSPYMWAGDQARGYSSLAWQLSAVLSSGLSGVPYMSYDMAGYQYGDYSRDLAYESQVFLRGLEFTAFTICMQTHGTVRRAYQFAEEDASYGYVPDIYRAYVKLHEHLTPYITELCEEASTTGMPVMRHLVLGWQNDKNVYDIEDEYTFGDAFLIAPILDDGFARDIYLPSGEWVDLNTGAEYSVDENGLWLRGYEVSLAELPTFYNKNTASEIAPTLVDGVAELYDYARAQLPTK